MVRSPQRVRRHSAPRGRIQLASVASLGEVGFSPLELAPDLQVNGFTRLGQLELLQGAFVDASGNGGGSVLLGAAACASTARGCWRITTDRSMGPAWVWTCGSGRTPSLRMGHASRRIVWGPDTRGICG